MNTLIFLIVVLLVCTLLIAELSKNKKFEAERKRAEAEYERKVKLRERSADAVF